VNAAATKTNLLDLDREGLERFFADTLGEKRFRAQQVMKWIYHRHVTDFAEMTDLGKALREKLEQHAEVVPPKILFEKPAADGTYKWLLGMDGGNAIECVFIPDKGRGTLCVSSQVGCGLNCSFCSTGKEGFNRNLSTAEIIGQVWVAAKHLGNVPHHQRKLTNVVMMGMGEPLLNFDNVVRAMGLMRDDNGFGLANKRVTLSTAGLVPMIDKLSEQSDVSLAVSLHAPTDELRTTLVPLNKKYPIDELMEACVRYALRKPRTSITFEYTLMKGINDDPSHARALAKLMRQLDKRVQRENAGKVNLIPFNPFPGTQYERSDEDAIRRFQTLLLDQKVLTMVRRTRGEDIDAACGQLKGQVLDRTRRQAEFRRKLQGEAPAQDRPDAA
jgi:23S rRNA (adenine2503-C2)-methyltransferase